MSSRCFRVNSKYPVTDDIRSRHLTARSSESHLLSPSFTNPTHKLDLPPSVVNRNPQHGALRYTSQLRPEFVTELDNITSAPIRFRIL